MCFNLYKALIKTKNYFCIIFYITLVIPLLYLVCIPKPYYIADFQNRKNTKQTSDLMYYLLTPSEQIFSYIMMTTS